MKLVVHLTKFSLSLAVYAPLVMLVNSLPKRIIKGHLNIIIVVDLFNARLVSV